MGLFSVAALLLACDGTTYNQGNDLTGDPPVDTGSDGRDDTGEDTDDTDDTDDTEETGDTGPDLCEHSHYPVHLTGWEKTFDVTYKGQAGTATERGLGLVGEDGEDRFYDVEEVLSAGTEGHSGIVHVACKRGTAEGMFVLGWDMSVQFSGFPIEATATHSNPRKILPPDFALGQVGSWVIDYDLVIETGEDTAASAFTYDVTGEIEEAGTVSITLFDGSTVEAYKLVQTYTQSEVILGTTNGYIEQWWAPGLGLVKEVHLDTSDSSTIMSKTLTGYSGLTPE